MPEREVDLLLVEDTPTDAALALRVLSRHLPSARVALVQDGAEALDYLMCRGEDDTSRAERLPRVVVLDLKLPKLDGAEVLRRLRADPATRPLPVVVFTSSQESRDIQESLSAGASSYVVKPVDADDFSRAVREIGSYWLSLTEPPPSSRLRAPPS